MEPAAESASRVQTAQKHEGSGDCLTKLRPHMTAGQGISGAWLSSPTRRKYGVWDGRIRRSMDT